MSLLELGEYMVGEPVYEVKASPRFDFANPSNNKVNTVYHCFVFCSGFDFLQSYPVVSVECDYTRALQEAITNQEGVYYCLIKNGVIFSMQYVRDESQIRMVED